MDKHLVFSVLGWTSPKFVSFSQTYLGTIECGGQTFMMLMLPTQPDFDRQVFQKIISI